MKRLLIVLALVLLVISPANAAFLDNLEAHFKLNSGALTTDSQGSNTLTNNNTVTENPGKLDVAGQFTLATSEYLSIADNASLSTGDIDFTIAAWVYLDSLSGALTVASKIDSGEFEWQLIVDSGRADRAVFQITDPDGASLGLADSSNFGGLSLATWYFIVAWHDSVGNTVNIQVNNATLNSVGTSGAPTDGSAAFAIGARATPGVYWDGRIDSVSFWKRVLTPQERTKLWNCTNGLDHNFSGPCNPHSVGIIVQ